MSDTGTLKITLLDVAGQPATDGDTDIEVKRAMDGRILDDSRGFTFPGTFSIDLPSFPTERALFAQISPSRYRLCNSDIFTLKENQILERSPHVFRNPAKWRSQFTDWNDLSAATFGPLKDVLLHSGPITVLENQQVFPTFTGEDYDSVDTSPAILAKTALLNLYFKMGKVAVPQSPGDSWFKFVNQILMIGRERFVGLVPGAMFELVSNIFNQIDQHPDFVRADTSLHTQNIPEPYKSRLVSMVSIKSNDDHGNLQLTMGQSVADNGEPAFLADCDIDEDLELVQHLADVFTHIFTGGTHPFDVHEFLIDQYHGGGAIDLGYDLI
jgi:hypothetical protein